jgi:hypothetical protein
LAVSVTILVVLLIFASASFVIFASASFVFVVVTFIAFCLICFFGRSHGTVRIADAEPNVEFQAVWRRTSMRTPVILVFALRDIGAGEELWVEYGEEYWRAHRRLCALNQMNDRINA